MTGELAGLAASVMVAGVVTGILAGLFGIGGGAVIVPVLFEVFRLLGVPEAVRMQLCIGTSLAIIVPTALRSYNAHKTRGLVLADVMRRWALPSMAGVAVGAALAALAPPDVFKGAFVLLACLIAAKLLFGGDRWVLGAELPGAAAMTGYGFAIGLGSSLMGIAGGSLVTMILTLYGKPIHNGVATAAGLGVPITLAGTLGYVLAGLPHQAELPPLSLGFVSVIGVVLIAPLSSWVAPVGARLAHRLPKRRLELAFGGFLLLIAARFLWSLLAPVL
ncbi:MAG TPA: sulfite exporter TauE/SafE family protein [Candidatus Sulfotelmatobacter sp.]|nr:sulfite exporter TauE/SafE family protein [Candidatus Sulfotelmatobacter sp.]